MLTHLRLLFTLVSMLWDVAPAGDPPSDPKPDDDPKPKGIEWTAEQQAEISRIAAKEARKAADKARQEEKDRIAAEQTTVQKEAQRKKDEDAGEFAKVRTSLEQERDAAKTDLTAATTELETLRGYVSGDVEAITKAVKAANDSPAAKALLDFYPGDDASALELLAWAQKAKPRLTELDTTTTTTRGAGPNPKPAGNHKIDEREEVNRIRSRIPQF